MIIYFLNILLIMFYGLIFGRIRFKAHPVKENEQLTDNEKKKMDVSFYLIVFQLFFIFAFRSTNVGGDLRNYVPHYSSIGLLSWSNLFKFNYEPGYLILNKLLNYFSPNANILLVVSGVIVTTSVSRFVSRYSKIPWLSFYLFVTLSYYNAFMNNIRSSIALSILLLSLDAIKERKFMKFMMYILIAFSFHKTSLIFIAVYFAYGIKSKKKAVLLFLTAGIIVVLRGNQIVHYLIYRFYPSYSNIITSGEGYSFFILLLLVTIFGYLFQLRESRNLDSQWLLYNMMLIAVVAQLFAFSLSYFTRAVTYFDIAMICFIPNVIDTLKIRGVKWIVIILVCILTSFFYWSYLTNDPGGVVPYSFMWSK